MTVISPVSRDKASRTDIRKSGRGSLFFTRDVAAPVDFDHAALDGAVSKHHLDPVPENHLCRESASAEVIN